VQKTVLSSQLLVLSSKLNWIGDVFGSCSNLDD